VTGLAHPAEGEALPLPLFVWSDWTTARAEWVNSSLLVDDDYTDTNANGSAELEDAVSASDHDRGTGTDGAGVQLTVPLFPVPLFPAGATHMSWLVFKQLGMRMKV
jgi:hypothetical protein